MITTEGVALIAQVYPVAIILLVLERGRVKPLRPIATTARAVWYAIAGLVQMAALIGATVSVALCVVSVASGRPLSIWEAGIVTASGLALFIFALNFAGELISDSIVESLQDTPWYEERMRLRKSRERPTESAVPAE